MTKGIVVVDIPETFGNCACFQYDGQYDRYCGVNGEDLMNIDWNSEKPDWCPINPMPERKALTGDVSNTTKMGEELVRAGFNACLDEIEGKM